MKYFAATAALVALMPSVLALTINTPASVVQCEPTLLSWTGGSPSYYLSIIPGGQPSAAPLQTFPAQSGTSMTWIANLSKGTPITFALKDSTGETAFTDTVTIQDSSDSSCINGIPDVAVSGAAGSDDTSTGSAGSTGSASDAASAPAGGSASSTYPASVSPLTGAARPATTPAAVASVGTSSRAIAAAGTTTTAASAATGGVGATTINTSGAESRVNVGSYGIVGVLGLLGAMFL